MLQVSNFTGKGFFHLTSSLAAPASAIIQSGRGTHAHRLQGFLLEYLALWGSAAGIDKQCEREALEWGRSPGVETYFTWFCSTSTQSVYDLIMTLVFLLAPAVKEVCLSLLPERCFCKTPPGQKAVASLSASASEHKLSDYLITSPSEHTWICIHGFVYVTCLQHSNVRANYDAAREARPRNGVH